MSVVIYVDMLIFSDTHFHLKRTVSAIQNHPEIKTILFLGDMAADAEELRKKFPDRDVYSVRGNNDFYSDDPEVLVIRSGTFSFFLTHGHKYDVKNGDYSVLIRDTKKRGCAAAIFGHTHLQTLTEEKGIILFNPGFAGTGQYGILRVSQEKFEFEEMQGF